MMVANLPPSTILLGACYVSFDFCLGYCYISVGGVCYLTS